MQMSSHVEFRSLSRRLARTLTLAAGVVLAVQSNVLADGAASGAAAEDANPGFLKSWNVVLGAGGIAGPEYEGAAKSSITALPFFSAERGRVAIDLGGIRIRTFESGSFSFTTRIGYELGRSEDDSDDLRGLGDVGAGGVVGGIVAYDLGGVALHAALDRTIGGSNGLVGTMGLDVQQVHERFMFGAGISATWADGNHMTKYFGVSRSQSILSGLAATRAEAGFKRADFTSSVSYMMTDHWLVTGQVGVGLMFGDAANSPVTRERIQPSAMILLGYRF